MPETSVTATSGEPVEQRSDHVQTDGRLTRAARTRASVVDALLTLNEQGNLRPTARDIATEAGVSLRSLYVHFDDLEALFVEAGDRHRARLAELLPPVVTTGDLDARLVAFLERRVVLFEQGAGVRRAALLQEPFSPALKEAVAKGRRLMSREVAASFSPEVAAAGEDGARLLSALDAVTGSAVWESLRMHQDLSVEAAADELSDIIRALVGAWVPGSATASATTTHQEIDER